MKLSLFNQTVILNGLSLSRYNNNDALAVIADLDWGEGYSEPTPVSINFGHGQMVTSDMLDEGCFIAKSYSEGEPLFNALVENDIIEVVGGPVPSGHVQCPICRLTEKGKKMTANYDEFFAKEEPKAEEDMSVDEFRRYLGLPVK